MLLLDDDSDFQIVFSLAFETRNIITIAFSSALDGLQYLSAARFLPAFVLLDLSMPGISGSEFIKRIRGEKKFKNIRVILISGRNDIATIAEKCGADGFMAKPFGLEEIDRLVKEEDLWAKSRLAPNDDVNLICLPKPAQLKMTS